MPYKDPAKQKAYDKARYEANKEHIKAYREKNKEKIKAKNKAWREAHKEEIKTYNKSYFQTPTGIKYNRINHWKNVGIIHPDYDALYDEFIQVTHCEDCNVEFEEYKLGEPRAKARCLDHDHDTGEPRGIVCVPCNFKRG